MEPLAVNHIQITKELFQESFALIFDKRKQKTLLLCGIAVAAFGALSLVVQSLLHKVLILGVPILMMGIFVVIWSFFLPRTACKRKYKAFCLKNGRTPVERRIEFYESSLSVYTEGHSSPLDVDYSEIKEWRTSQHLVLLICEDRSGILLDRANFQTKTWEQIEALLNQQKSQQSASTQITGSLS